MAGAKEKDAKITAVQGGTVENLQNNTAEPEEPKKPVSKKRGRSKAGASILLVVILIAAIAAAAFFYAKYQDSQNKLKHPEVAAKAQTEILVEKIGKHVELPPGEQPTIATVSDVSKLSTQTFFANAQNGDKVLIYSKAKKAILYRPSEDRVVNIAPLNVNNGQ